MRRIIVFSALLFACSGSSTDDDKTTGDGGVRDSGVTVRDGGAPGATIADLTDTFDGAGLDPSWSVHRPEVLDIAVANGELSLTVNQHALWFNDEESGLVHKSVSGNFKVSATVHARMASNSMLPPDRYVHLGGLMARNPDSASQNYVFIVIGWDEVDLSVESKSTIDGVSNFEGPPWASGDAELRICRINSTFTLYKRTVGATTWEVASTRQRGDLPQTLQVGANAYAAADPGLTPDLTVRFEGIVFAPAESMADCTTD